GRFAPAELTFNNLSTNADSYNWNFGDYDSELNKSSEKNPSHLYSLPGEYEISLEAVNTQTGEMNKLSKKIILKSNYNTFVKNEGSLGNYEAAYSLVQLPSDEIVTVAGSPGKGSAIIKFDVSGNKSGEKTIDYQAYDISANPANNGLRLLGIKPTRQILVQNLGEKLDLNDTVVFNDKKNFKINGGTPRFAYSITDELGIIANTIGDKYPIDILFEKLNKTGHIVPIIDRTFKYIGTKVANDIIPLDDGGYALTGYYQEEKDEPFCLFLGKIDRKQHGELHLVASDINYIGWNIEVSHQGGFAILSSDQNIENSNLYEMNFMLVDKDGGPTDCSTILPCSIKKEDIFGYRPSMIKNNDGYVIASQGFNGVNYNIGLYWIDKTGKELLKYHEINLPNDQFVMDLIQTNDGGYAIVGTERAKNKYKAILIKTDPFGMLN
ncbi:MAG: PKD domain-containing protein, partial [Prolixibacteraceae bacterium]|nr:PKD domain-containing protein [Prolixibacteraceae bacterium]